MQASHSTANNTAGVDLPCAAGRVGLQSAPSALPRALGFNSHLAIKYTPHRKVRGIFYGGLRRPKYKPFMFCGRLFFYCSNLILLNNSPLRGIYFIKEPTLVMQQFAVTCCMINSIKRALFKV